MSAAQWLPRATAKKGAAVSSSQASRSATPQVVSTSTTTFGGGVKDATGKTAEYSSMDDQCPVCKSDRYLNPKLRLLVSSTCYHKMCESCIDRLFTLGPAPCPICHKVIRKLAFMPQTFEDLVVEKEVMVRRRMAREFNKRREDFIDLRAYNDYLEEVEDIAFNLINDIDVEEMNKCILAFRAENAALIELNMQREERDLLDLKEEEERNRKEKEESARLAAQEDEKEREQREKEKQEIINRLETGSGSASKIIKKARAENLKKASRLSSQSAAGPSTLLRSRLTSTKKMPTIPDEPHVALKDTYYAYDDRYVLRRDYDDAASENVRRDREGIMRAGGYRLEEAWERAIRSAIMGLDLTPLEANHPTEPTQDIVMAAS